MRSTRSLIVMATAFSVSAAHAEIYNYICKDHGKSYPLRVDDLKNTLAWTGGIYKITPYENGEHCAKCGWRVEKDGASFDFCTATQGSARFEQNDESIGVECEQKR